MAYVKFIQGTRAQFDALTTKDVNTLYFITGDDASVVSLYMGDRFVSGVDHLADLKDVLVENLADKDFLVYDAANAQWKNLSFEGLIAEIEANIEHQHIAVDENVFELGEDEVLKLIGFEGAAAGAQLAKGEDGKVTWVTSNATTDELAAKIEEIEAVLNPVDEEGNPVEGGVVSEVEDLKTNVGTEAVYDEETGDVVTPATGIYAELETKADAEEVATVTTKVETITTQVETLTNDKANVADVYTKDEVYTKQETEDAINEAVVAADHLRRVVVENLDAINVDADDALLYIYMVPTGTVYGDDKYDEYLVIEESDGTRKVERVGSWEVDLTAYAKIADVNTALDKKADKATTLAGYGIIDAYTKEETLTKIEEKITEVNGGESAGEVLAQLNSYKETNDAAVETLETKVATIAEGAEVNVIQTVEDSEFNLTDRHLSIKEVAATKVTGLAQHEALVALNNAIGVNTEAIANNKKALEDVTATLNNYVLKETYDAEIASIKQSITWGSLG